MLKDDHFDDNFGDMDDEENQNINKKTNRLGKETILQGFQHNQRY